MKRLFCILLLVFSSTLVFSQNITDFCNEGDEFMEKGDYVTALAKYTSAKSLLGDKKNKKAVEIWLRLADCNAKLSRYPDAESYCKMVLSENPSDDCVLKASEILTRIYNLSMEESEMNIIKAQNEKEMVIMQMNYCISALTNIINSPSLSVYEYETEQLLNNLTITQIVGIEEIIEFRMTMLKALSELRMTEQERDVLYRVQMVKRNNQLWNSLSSAVTAPFVVFAGAVGNSSQGMTAQAIFAALLTAVRTGFDAVASKRNMECEEIQALWNLKKRDLSNYTELRKGALELTKELYKRYGLADSDRLTEKTADIFNKIIAMEPEIRIRQLIENKEKYCQLLEYDYHLGMAYVDDNQYEKARLYFDKYVEKYTRHPLFIEDARLGCIALTELQHEVNLTNQDKIDLIKQTLDNIPNSGSARVMCAMKYREMGMDIECDSLIRSSLETPIPITDIELVVAYAISQLKNIKVHKDLFDDVCKQIENCKLIGFSTYLNYLLTEGIFDWDKIASMFKIKNTMKSEEDTVFKGVYIESYGNYRLNLENFYIFRESVEACEYAYMNDTTISDKVNVNQLTSYYKDGITLDEIKGYKDFEQMNLTPKILSFFFEPIIDGFIYMVRDNIDFDDIADINSDYCCKILSSTNLTPDEIKKICTYCKKHKPIGNHISVECKLYDPQDSTMHRYLDNIFNCSKKVFNRIGVIPYDYKDAFFGPKYEWKHIETVHPYMGESVNNRCRINNIASNNSKMKFVQSFDGINPYQSHQVFKPGNEDYLSLLIMSESPVVIKYHYDKNCNQYNIFSIERNGMIMYKDTPHNYTKTVLPEKPEEPSWMRKKYNKIRDYIINKFD